MRNQVFWFHKKKQEFIPVLPILAISWPNGGKFDNFLGSKMANFKKQSKMFAKSCSIVAVYENVTFLGVKLAIFGTFAILGRFSSNQFLAIK